MIKRWLQRAALWLVVSGPPMPGQIAAWFFGFGIGSKGRRP
jgi:hypothetical protein